MRIGLSETSIGSINGHHHDNFGCYPFDSYENIP
jgi:hypothetical protein